MGMGSESKEARGLFWTLKLLGLVWLCLAGSITRSDAGASMAWKGNNNQRDELLLLLLHSHSALNYVSKRRVPNGPDPIHNRRTVKSRQPSTRA